MLAIPRFCLVPSGGVRDAIVNQEDATRIARILVGVLQGKSRVAVTDDGVIVDDVVELGLEGRPRSGRRGVIVGRRIVALSDGKRRPRAHSQSKLSSFFSQGIRSS